MHGVVGNAASVARNATSFRLLVEGEPDLENASWHQIAGELERIEAGHRSFVILVLDDQNFVQTLGNRDALVVEWRTKSEDTMSHYVLGRKGSGKTELQCIAGSNGNSEVVLAREVLDLTDALIIFRAFHELQKVPDAYHLRDVTKRNAARAIAIFAVRPGAPVAGVAFARRARSRDIGTSSQSGVSVVARASGV